VIDRYLLVPALMIMVFGAVALGGWTMLREGLWVRRVWAVVASLIIIYGVVFTATRVNFHEFDVELKLRGHSHRSLEALLDKPEVRRAYARCGHVISTPSHKLVPDTRWVLGASADQVLARADARTSAKTRAATQRGVALFVVDRGALLRQALVEKSDDVFDNIPAAGFLGPIAFTDYYSAYVRC
jgi:hypothetical protein